MGDKIKVDNTDKETAQIDVGEYEFFKEKPDNAVWEVRHIGYKGEILFSFDKKTILNLWTDYPDKFTEEQKEIFDREQPYWAEFFRE